MCNNGTTKVFKSTEGGDDQCRSDQPAQSSRVKSKLRRHTQEQLSQQVGDSTAALVRSASKQGRG